MFTGVKGSIRIHLCTVTTYTTRVGTVYVLVIAECTESTFVASDRNHKTFT